MPASGASSSRRVLYCHGGGYTSCTPAEYRGFTTRLAASIGSPVFIFDYRKAPECGFPAAVDDAEAALRYVATHGPLTGRDGDPRSHASEIILMGDSAGGGLALGLLIRLQRLAKAAPEGRPPPHGAARLRCVTISAYTDLLCSTPTYESRAWFESTKKGDVCFSGGNPDQASADLSRTDALLICSQSFSADQDREYGRQWAANYVPAAVTDTPEAARHPEAAPFYSSDAQLGALPPTLMIVGDEEQMLFETTDLVSRATKAGASVTLSVYPRMWHVWPMYSEGCGSQSQFYAKI